jgi:hypothetical protein
MASSVPRVRLHGTEACHLCETAEALVAPIAAAFGWSVEPVDVAEDDDLFERWGERVPVLERTDTGAVLCWPFGAREVEAVLGEPRRG